MYAIGTQISVQDTMQAGYMYEIVAPCGSGFAPDFAPHFTPKEMLELGIFEGKYCNDCQDELPRDWFENAKISEQADPTLNYFGVKSRQPLVRLAGKRMDLWARSQRLVSMVLPLLFREAVARDRSQTNCPLAWLCPPCGADPRQL